MMEILPDLPQRLQPGILELLGRSEALAIEVVLKDGVDYFVGCWSFSALIAEQQLIEVCL